MPAPDDDTRDDALLRRLYDEPDADGADGELAAEVASYRRIRGAIADYARATEVEPPSRGLDELMAAARSRVQARTAVATEPPGLWARLRAWLQPILAHPALASAAMVIVVAGIAGVLYVKGRANVAAPEAHAPAPTVEARPAAVGSAAAQEYARADDEGMVARLEDGSGSGAPPQVNQTAAPGSGENDESGRRQHANGDKLELATGTRERPTKPANTGGITKGKAKPAGRTTSGDTDALDVGGGGPGSVAVGSGTVFSEGNDATMPPSEPIVQAPQQPSRPTPTGPQRKPTTTKTAPDRAPAPPPSVDETATIAPTPAPAPPAKDQSKNDQQTAPKPAMDLGQLTRQARTAARAGDCAVVKSIGTRVRAASATYYQKTFATDADIKKCL